MYFVAKAVAGASMGIVHVLAGPDHLSALAALSVGQSWKASTIGVRWGIGHSSGLILIALLFIALRGQVDIRAIGRKLDSVVGIMMLGIGAMGIVGARRKQEKKMLKKDLDIDTSKAVDITEECISPENGEFNPGNTSEPQSGHFTCSVPQWIKDHIETVDSSDPTTQRVISVGVGLIHGVAGPGAILGVLPALEMQSPIAAVAYICSFVLGSTLSMGIFAGVYGEITKRLGSAADSIEYSLRLFSSSFSIIVGVIWIAMAASGKLENLFH